MIRKVFTVIYTLSAITWFYDLLRVMTGTYEYRALSVGVAFLVTGIWMAREAYANLKEEYNERELNDRRDGINQ